MNSTSWRSLLVLACCTLAAYSSYASDNETTTSTCQPMTVEFINQPIFSDDIEQHYFFHDWANKLHINTTESTLRQESSWFVSQCQLTAKQLAEWERKLRKLSYIEEADIKVDDKAAKVTVTTRDNWSLLPTLDFSRKGGKNRYALGVKERNFLGRGIELDLKTFENSRRSGFIANATVPHVLFANSELGLRFADNDDGQQQAISLAKKFASSADSYAYKLFYNDNERVDTLFHNDNDEYEYGHDILNYFASYQHLLSNNQQRFWRMQFGYGLDRHRFAIEDDNTAPFLPADREFSALFVGLEFQQKQHQKLSNIYQVGKIEDINFGWHIQSRLAISDGQDDNTRDSSWQLSASKFFNLGAQWYLAFNSAVDYDQNHQQDRTRALVTGELFWTLADRWTLYLKSANQYSDNEYLDRIVTIGGDTGLRGYPVQYQHGENSHLYTLEGRYYPNLNWWRLFNVAGVAFYDRGKATGDSILVNDEDGWLDSVGLGLRLYSPHAAGDNKVIHVDLAYALSDNDDVKGLEIRLLARRHF
ncbi:hypothetical protein [Thalassotalea sp. Y01]|uniref:hypothetical protein n=1 Tax=Thalassotalea sp. Y01 TaxID=2729613 RepID=UPI00145D653E|nr:hypothetical protein [Thalassotalea sp. Y01]NMP15749.1 hypothetical protein [Thalassotalea sp. Y01]